MKISVYFHGYSPEKGGGYTFEHEILLSLCELSEPCRHELVLFFENVPDDDIITLITKKGYKAVMLEPPQSVPWLRKMDSKIRKKLQLPVPPEAPHPLRVALEREKVELIWFVADCYIPIEQIDIPYIATVWDIQHCLQPWFPEVGMSAVWQWRENFYSIFLRRASYILAPNMVGQKELSLFYGLPPERFRLLPHPSPRIEHVPEEKVNTVLAKYRLERGYLFYPAGFWPHKNHANLLMAVELLNSRYGETKHLVFVGSDKGNLDYIRSMGQTLGVEGQVHFLDFVPRDELIALYKGAFVLTYVSLFGPENLPPLEAFLCGCPVIISDYSGAREQCGDAAMFVNGLDPEAIAKAIQELEFRPESRLSLIERGLNRADLYTGESYIRDVFKIFDEFEPVRHNWGSTY